MLKAVLQLDIKGINKVRGQPFSVSELVRGVRSVVKTSSDHEIPDESTPGTWVRPEPTQKISPACEA